MNKKKQEHLHRAVDKMLGAQYNPGSNKAIEMGCACPILDNSHGFGYMGQKGIFVMTADCPLHGYMCQTILDEEIENDEPTDEHWGDHSE